MARFYTLYQNIEYVIGERIPGDFVELGDYRGNSAAMLAKFARSASKGIIPLMDTYIFGFPGEWKLFGDTSVELVKSLVGTDNVRYVVGQFPASVGQLDLPEQIAFAHIDCDLYEAALSALALFYPRLSAGGMLIVHDYSSRHWPGIAQAVDQFFADKPEKPILIPDKSGSAAIRKMSIVPRRQVLLSPEVGRETEDAGPWASGPAGATEARWAMDEVSAAAGRSSGRPFDMNESNVVPCRIPFSVVVPTAYGLQIVLRYDDGLRTKPPTFFRTGLAATHREIKLLASVLRCLGDSTVFVDIGANLGSFSLALSRVVGPRGKVHAFEPQRMIFNMLAGTMALNSVENVFCYHIALSNSVRPCRDPAV